MAQDGDADTLGGIQKDVEMNARMTRRSIAAAVVALVVTGSAGCASSDADRSATTTAAAGATTTAAPASGTTDGASTGGATPVPADDLDARLSSVPPGSLTDVERAGLLRMREEEKLARDVYTTLGDLWGLRTFDNITAAEETHMAAVATLLDRYGLADPAAGRAVGSFTDPAIQALYDQLVAQGRRSATEALAVGAAIEELDIVDLRERATAVVDIALVYADLERGSRNHLRAFTSQLERSGVEYRPVHLASADFDAIVASAIERGGER